MRPLVLALAVLLSARFAVADDRAEYAKLFEDAARTKALKSGHNILKNYFKFAAEVDKGKSKFITKRDKKLAEFMAWLDASEKTMGIDLRTKPFVVCELLDDARIGELAKWKRGIDYVRVDNVAGMERFEYAVRVPTKYTPKSKVRHRYPLVVTLHERAINPKHPAFRSTKEPGERGRVAIFNNWDKESPAAELAVIIAPTGGPNGFMFTKDQGGDLQVLYRSMGKGLTNYRTDWDRVFLEVSGPAFRVACEQALMFAGIILRDREGYNRLPMGEEEFFAFENLNGTPLLYIVDEATWDKVGRPLSDALAAAYKKMGKEENFILMKSKRDGNGALKGNVEDIAKFLSKHKRPRVRTSFKWRYYSPTMASPLPIVITKANYDFDEAPALKDKAGTLEFNVTSEKYSVKKLDKEGKPIKDDNGKDVIEEGVQNVIDIKITEAEGLTISLFDGLVNLDMPVTVKINGAVVHERLKVKRDWNEFASLVLPYRFFMVPFVAEIRCDVEHKPQFVKPKEAGAANETPGQNGDKKDDSSKTAGKTDDK